MAEAPSLELQYSITEQANFIRDWFSYALQFSKTKPIDDINAYSLDLSQENQNKIRASLLNLINSENLIGKPPHEVSTILEDYLKKQSIDLHGHATISTAAALNSSNLICYLCMKKFPQYDPFKEIVIQLAYIFCPGTIAILGPLISDDIFRTWPFFADIFLQFNSNELMQNKAKI